MASGGHRHRPLRPRIRHRASGIANPWDVTGGGTIDVLDGDVYEVAWEPRAGFSLELV
jgi:hypothetical protein